MLMIELGYSGGRLCWFIFLKEDIFMIYIVYFLCVFIDLM